MSGIDRIERILEANGFTHVQEDEPHVDDWTLDQRPAGHDLIVTHETRGWRLSRSPKEDEDQGSWTDIGHDMDGDVLLSFLSTLVPGFKRGDVAPAEPIAEGSAPPEWKVHTPRLLSEIMTNNHMGILKIPMNIFGRMLAAVAARASALGDVELDDLMIRLALYDQGDPSSDVFDLRAATKINEQRVRDQHAVGEENPDGSDEADLDEAIRRARDDDPRWDRADRVQDWRNHVGSATRRQWISLPFAARVAVALDAQDSARNENWD